MPLPSQPPGEPPRPSATATRHEFGARLRDLRKWSGLTQRALEDGHPALTDATISDHERGVRLPRLEWVTAYILLCLRRRHPDATRAQLDAELKHWRTAWTRLEHADTGHAPAIPANPEAAAPGPPAAAAAVTDDNPRRARWPRRRVWLIGGATAVVIIAGALTVTATGVFDSTPNATPGTTPAPLSSSLVPAAPVHASGTVEDLRGVEGIDLDTNNRADQEAPGGGH